MAHLAREVAEPVSAVLINAETGLRWLDRKPPELEKVRQALDRIVKDSKRASEMIERTRVLVSG